MLLLDLDIQLQEVQQILFLFVENLLGFHGCSFAPCLFSWRVRARHVVPLPSIAWLTCTGTTRRNRMLDVSWEVTRRWATPTDWPLRQSPP